jgi:hypothetical protein
MKNGRCRLHGGLSTGPRTKEGMDRMRAANTKHGRYAKPGNPITGPHAGVDYHEFPTRRSPGLNKLLKGMKPILRDIGWED